MSPDLSVSQDRRALTTVSGKQLRAFVALVLFSRSQLGAVLGRSDLILSSCNYTTSSRANCEAGVWVTAYRQDSVVEDWITAWDELWEQGSSIEDFEGANASRKAGKPRAVEQ